MAANPSNRHSQLRTSECRLRRCDQALHETTQRFVESLNRTSPHQGDVKLCQFADIQFACKKLTQDTWYWLEPLTDRARVGYVVFLPAQPIVWMDEQFKYSYRIPMRVSSQIYEKKSVFLASLDINGELRFEDCWMSAGDFVRQQPFSKRWEKVREFYGQFYREDDYLQQGLRISIAKYTPLTQALSWGTVPAMMYAQGERAGRRLRIPLTQTPPVAQVARPARAAQSTTNARSPLGKVSKVPVLEECAIVNDESETGSTSSTVSKSSLETSSPSQLQSVAPQESDGIRTARAVAHEDFPDTYTIWIGGEKKGFGAVQELELSQSLRAKGKDLQVRVKWNEEFHMWEILSLV